MLGWLRRWPGRARWWSAVAAGIVVVVVAIAILSGSDSAAAGQQAASSTSTTSVQSTGSPETSDSTLAIDGPPALLRVVSDGVDVQSMTGDFVAAVDGQSLTEGVTVRTDASGRAVIEYFDGSVTRLDGDTTLQITMLRVLDNEARSKVIVALQSTGSTYSRVVPLTDPESRFDVTTLAAATSVVGTRYFVRIDPITGSTTVVVVEGTVTVTDPADPSREVTVPAGSMVEFSTDGIYETNDRIPEDLLAPEWVEFNCDQDVVDLGGDGDCDGVGVGVTTTTSTPPSTSSATTTTTVVSTTAVTTTTAASSTTTSTSPPALNQAPEVTTPTDRSSVEGDCVSMGLVASDPDLDTITWSAVGLPDGLSIDPATGVISGVLGPTSAGSHTVTVTVTDDGSPEAATAVSFGWAVTARNDAPETAGPHEGSTDEDTPGTMTLRASDIDNACDELTVTITRLPEHGTLSADDGASFLDVGATIAVPAGVACSVSLRYDPDQDFNGADSLEFTVHDTLLPGVVGEEEESSAATFAITVDPVNDAPFTTSENLTARYFTTPMNNIDAVTFELSGGDVDDADSDLVAYVTINSDSSTALGVFYQFCDGCPSPTPVATSGPDAGMVTDPGHRVQWFTLSVPPTGVAPVDLTEVLSYTLRDPSGAVSNTKTIVATVSFAALPDDSEDPPPDPGSTTTTTLTGDTSAPTSGGGRGR